MHDVHRQVHKVQPGEAFEGGLKAAEYCAMLDGDGGEMGMADQVASATGTNQQAAKQRGVPFAGQQQVNVGVRQPLVHERECIFGGKRVGENAAPRGQPQETCQRCPAESRATWFAKGILKSAAGG